MAAPLLPRCDLEGPCGPGACERPDKFGLSPLQANHTYLASKNPAGLLSFCLLRAARWAKLAPLKKLAEWDLGRVLEFRVT